MSLIIPLNLTSSPLSIRRNPYFFKELADGPGIKQKGYTHLFVMEFENLEDRNYYVSQDPTHQGYIKTLLDLPIGEVQVLDFTEGGY